ncbi:type VI secretion system lipoprotein TssJ [Povalibacter sp.]|uniref:type VI secretion system lipoprotein TssJ n=1 Tax=Povalibacter sp. TaxID=1962978 RepID=UPI002F41418D
MRLRWVSWSLIVIAALAGAGCGSAPAKPAVAKAQIAASADVNPNQDGRASPVHVRIFQLKEDGAFMGSDFWALVDKEQETLAASLVQRLEFDLSPGESREFELKVDPDARVLAVMAEYADYRNAQWRVVAQTPNKSLLDLVKKDRVSFGIEKSKVSITVGD